MPATVWVATANIYIGSGSSFVLAYTPGNRVPDSVVASLGLAASGLVQQATITDAGTSPNWRGTDPITRSELDEALAGIGGGAVDSVNTQTGVVVLDADDIADTAAKVFMLPAERTKLAAVAAGASANATDAQLRDRATHTGVQTAATISDLREAVEDYVAALLGAGTNVTLTYTDNGTGAGSLSIASTGGGTTDPEAVRDAIGIALVGAGLVSVAVNDAGDTITLSTTATANSTDAQLRDRTTHTGVMPVSGAPAGGVSYVLQNSDGTWPARRTSRTDILGIWVKIVAASADPAAVTSPAVNGAYANDLVVGV